MYRNCFVEKWITVDWVNVNERANLKELSHGCELNSSGRNRLSLLPPRNCMYAIIIMWAFSSIQLYTLEERNFFSDRTFLHSYRHALKTKTLNQSFKILLYKSNDMMVKTLLMGGTLLTVWSGLLVKQFYLLCCLLFSVFVILLYQLYCVPFNFFLGILF